MDLPYSVIPETPGRRITEVIASPNGQYLACAYVRQNRGISDTSWLLFRETNGSYVPVGEMAPAALTPRDFSSTTRRSFVVLDDGHCVFLQSNTHEVELVSHAATAQGMVETARWEVCYLHSYYHAFLGLLSSGKEALVLATDHDAPDADWGGGSVGECIESWYRVDLGSGEVREDNARTGDASPISIHDYSRSRGLSVLIAMGAPAWVGTRDPGESRRLRELIVPLTLKKLDEFAVQAGQSYLLTNWQVIGIASGNTVVQIKEGGPEAPGSRVFTRFHDLSPDGCYASSTVVGGHFELWNVPNRTSWRPALPSHGGVHCAAFLPNGRTALGTVEGGIMVVDCSPGCPSGRAPW